MKIRLTSLCFATLFTFALADNLSATEPSFVPKTFTAYIGGFNGPSYLVELHDGALTYTSGLRGARIHSSITPTPAQWRKFRETLDVLDVWHWRSDYSNETIRDGTQWQLTLEYTDRAVKTGGSNAFPKQFDPYLAAVQKLLDGKAFK